MDPRWFNADPDPAFFPIADPGIQFRIQGFDVQKLKKNYNCKFFIYLFFGSKIAIYLCIGLHKGRTRYRRSLQASKENIQHCKPWKFFTFFYICGSFWPSWILDPATHINADPCGYGSTTPLFRKTKTKPNRIKRWIVWIQLRHGHKNIIHRKLDGISEVFMKSNLFFHWNYLFSARFRFFVW